MARANGIKKGCYFKGQLTSEETLYHTSQFVNAKQHLISKLGEKSI